ncbi:formate dehydrogenase subunit delta [Saccharospirillum salsuginis]|uniref:Formate dehydrogenase subunit delta n=1 Tax=Saccharospirillum salsuginis TaxID=418750 RepID=A0A918KCT7_9GAMM|nr:formate dehydrogenase subunit delta [Saccharospirillum salsuginis]GGX57404.1 hypothetical protein GCM10007392_26210 [Saccharospirillum salsuginis]
MSNQTETLVKMINQIAENTPSNGDSDAAADAVVAHVKKFWARPMKIIIKEYLSSSNGNELVKIAEKAILRL